MGVKLYSVEPAAGLAWVGQGFSLLARRPLLLTAIFAIFISAAAMLSLLPWLGGLVVMAAIPYLGLVYLLASHHVQRGEAVSLTVLAEPWQGSSVQRERLLWLCLAYAVAAATAMLLAGWLDGGGFESQLMAMEEAARQASQTPDADLTGADLPVADGFWLGAWLRMALIGAISIPFWHAPGLIWWGGQPLAQALFSSTVAVWRARGAFALYALGWVGALLAASLAAGLVMGVVGASAAVWPLLFALSLSLTAAFYVSLYPCWVSCFGPPQAPSGAPEVVREDG